VDDNGGAYIVPAFSGLFAPYWRSDASGVIVGLTRFVNKGHLARAVLEANAYQALDIVEAMNKGFRGRLEPPESGRRHGGQRTAHAVSGRPAQRSGNPTPK
jgi:glycerol kinase